MYLPSALKIKRGVGSGEEGGWERIHLFEGLYVRYWSPYSRSRKAALIKHKPFVFKKQKHLICLTFLEIGSVLTTMLFLELGSTDMYALYVLITGHDGFNFEAYFLNFRFNV